MSPSPDKQTTQHFNDPNIPNQTHQQTTQEDDQIQDMIIKKTTQNTLDQILKKVNAHVSVQNIKITKSNTKNQKEAINKNDHE